MKSIIATLVFVCYCLLGIAQNYIAPKLSAGTKMYMHEQKKNKGIEPTISSNCVYRLDAENNVYISSFIRVYPSFDESALKHTGAKVGTKAGNVWTVQIPNKNFDVFSRINGIEYIDLDVPMERHLDSARKFTRVDSVHQGILLPQPYTGKDVVVGVIDVGFDYSHPTFYDQSYQRYRIKRVWEQKTIGTPPQGFSFGSEYIDSASILNKHHDVVEETHGTHVAGIAAGSGVGGDTNTTRYRGMAYKSEIVMVGIFPSAAHWLNSGLTDMIDGMNYIYNYAASVNKPAVVNLSWGGPIGPKDGKSLFSEACNNLTGNGKIFVVSGGNNGQNKLHLQKTFTTTDTIVRTISTFSNNLSEKRNLIDIWGDTSKTFCIELSLYSGINKIDSTTNICIDNTVHDFNLIGTNGDTCFVNISSSDSEYNGKPHILVQLYSRVTNSLCIRLKGTSGKVNMWQGFVLDTHGYYGTFSQLSYPWAVNGDVNMTISDMVTTSSAIGVAAYNSKPVYKAIDGANYSYPGYQKGRIALFSSLGPTADGRKKPDIAGPGLALASSINSLDTTYYSNGSDYTSVVSNFVSPQNGATYAYAVAAGTSMSCPAVSGIIALLLEINHYLKPADVLQILSQTAIKDVYTTATPNGNIWGAGKVNAYKAIKSTLTFNGITHVGQSNQNVLVYPNPSNGNYKVFLESDKSSQLVLTDISGNICLVKNIVGGNQGSTIDLDVQQFASGTYLLQIKNDSGNEFVKLVKQ